MAELSVREIEVHGKRIKLYRVGAYDNAWCSDRRLASRIEHRRREQDRQLQLLIKKNRELERAQSQEEALE